MSINYAPSPEDLNKNYDFPGDEKRDPTGLPKFNAATPNSKIVLMTDKSSNESNRIGFLNQCKLELSAEVIRWKEENHRLRKENETSEHKVHKLQSAVEELSQRNKELESSLLSSKQDYEKIRMHSLAINEENRILHRKLSQNSTKYYSYPLSEFNGSPPALPLLNQNASQCQKIEVAAATGWEEVSHKLLEQMKMEMRELQELGQTLAINELSSNTGTSSLMPPSSYGNDPLLPSQQNVDESKFETDIISLTNGLESLKERLREQSQKLSMLCDESIGSKTHDFDNYDHKQDNAANKERANSVASLSDWEVSESAEQNLKKPTDETFRAYFTQQLSNSKSTEELQRMMKFYMDDNQVYSDQNNMQKAVESNVLKSKTAQKSGRKSQVQTTHFQNNIAKDGTSSQVDKFDQQHISEVCRQEEERVCPICEEVFPQVFSQKEFESHVVAHLEAESVSLLDQYEII